MLQSFILVPTFAKVTNSETTRKDSDSFYFDKCNINSIYIKIHIDAGFLFFASIRQQTSHSTYAPVYQNAQSRFR